MLGLTGLTGITEMTRLAVNGPDLVAPTLGSTRAGGQDDGSLHKLPQIKSPPCTYVTCYGSLACHNMSLYVIWCNDMS